jgi:hypothetical protein
MRYSLGWTWMEIGTWRMATVRSSRVFDGRTIALGASVATTEMTAERSSRTELTMDRKCESEKGRSRGYKGKSVKQNHEKTGRE